MPRKAILEGHLYIPPGSTTILIGGERLDRILQADWLEFVQVGITVQRRSPRLVRITIEELEVLEI